MASNKVRLYVNKRARGLIRSIVERNGTRAIDTGVFTVPHSVPITKGDDVAYVQDPVDTTHLTGIWNFFDNTRDESGHELDGAEDATYVTDAIYADACDGRVIHIQSGTTKAVKIVDRTSTSSILKLMDFVGQFDIIIWYAHVTSTGVLFGKGISGTKVQIEIITGNYVKATIGSTVITGTNKTVSGSTQTSSGYSFIRLKRDENDLVTLSVNGTTVGTPTEVVGIVAATSTDLYIGGDYAGANRIQGKFAQVRLYNGGYLSDEDFTTLRQTRRQPNTIKFGGTVWKVDEQPTHKVAHCKGYSRILHDTIISTSPSLTPDNGWTTSGDVYKNIFTDKDGFEILTELMRAYTGTGTSGVKVVDVDGSVTGSTKEYAEYKAVGTLFNNVVIISINTSVNDSSFSIDGRKILRMEDQDIDYTRSSTSFFSPILFKNGHIKVTDLGYDDTSLVTQVVGYTQIPVVEKTITKYAADFEDGGSTKLDMKLGHETPISITISVVQNDSGTPTLTNVNNTGYANTSHGIAPEPSDLTEYKIIKKSTGYNHAIFGGSAEHNDDVYTAVYKHEDIFPNSGRNHYYSASNSSVVTALGSHHKSLYLPQLTNSSSATNSMGLVSFLGRFVRRFQVLNRRFLITSPTLINHIRENYKVRIGDDFHGQAHDIDTPDNDLQTMVRSVKYLYPEGITEINCGNHMLDAYDIDNAFGTAVHELRSTLSQTETS